MDNNIVRDSITSFDAFSQSLNQGLSKSFSPQAILMFIFLIIAVVTLIVIYEMYRSKKNKQKLQGLAWQKFDKHVHSMELSEENINLLRRITRQIDLQDPYSIVKSPHVFEHCIEQLYKEDKSISKEIFAKIRDLRKAMEFLPLSREIAFTSTRQFNAGDKCAVQIPDTGHPSHRGMCLILAVNEQNWSIERPDGPSIAPGTWVKIDLTRSGDAEYSFKTQALSDSNDALVLSHMGRLQRTQQRNWVRVDVSIPVEVVKVENGQAGDMFTGQIIDMSGGGLGMALPAKLPNDTILILEFDLPGHERICNLMVKVVRVAGPWKGDPLKTIHSVAFHGDVGKIQELVTQYVFEKQRQDVLIKQN